MMGLVVLRRNGARLGNPERASQPPRRRREREREGGGHPKGPPPQRRSAPRKMMAARAAAAGAGGSPSCRAWRLLLRASGAFPWGRAAPLGLGGPPAHQRRLFSNSKILVELDESTGVAAMKLKSPPVNSLSLDFLTEFCISLEKLENNKACRGLILTSAVPQIFSAGLDITEMCGKSEEHYAEFWRAVQEMWLTLYSSSIVTVAAVNGSSPAGGCLMALSCDYRIMAENPKYSIGLNETQLGIVAPFWFKETMLNTVGHRCTERSLQLGLLYSPREALKIGLVDELVPEEKIQNVAGETMAQWLAIPDHARQLSKSSLRKPTVDRLLAHREADVQDFVRFVSRDSIQKSLQVYMGMLKRRKA